MRSASRNTSGEAMAPGTTPFHGFTVQRQSNLMFNLAAYANLLVGQFRQAGGRIERREFHAPAEFAELPQKVVINCTGYGARALLADEAMVPVRGQIAWLVPQREFDYGVSYRGLNVIPRTDGIAVQDVAGGDMRGYGDVVPLGASLAPLRGTDAIMWTVKFRNGQMKRFKFAIRTTPWGSIVPFHGLPAPSAEETKAPGLSGQAQYLGVDKLPTVAKN